MAEQDRPRRRRVSPREGFGAEFLIVWAVFFGMIALGLAALVLVTANAQQPYELHLPDGPVQQACGAQYAPDAKLFAFDLCVEIFSDGFEGASQ